MTTDDDFAAIAQSIADAPKQEVAIGTTTVAPAVNSLHFSPELMIDLIIRNPSWSHKELGGVFGKSASWVAQVLAMQSFQDLLEPRRHEVLNPEYAMTLDERFRALTIRAVTVMQEKLESGKALPDLTILKTAELGIKALGMGQKQKEDEKPVEPPKNTSEAVAEKIMAAMQRRKEAAGAVDVESREVSNE